MRGFRGYRRNEESPFRALTPLSNNSSSYLQNFCRNEESPFRALTQIDGLESHIFQLFCRNEESPFRALTLNSCVGFHFSHSVEMKKARLGR